MKIGIVGCGHVGSTSAYACVMRGVGTHITLVDINQKLARAQAEDILHATPFAHSCTVDWGGYESLQGSGIVIISAGVNQKPGETRLDLLKRNADIFEQMIPSVIQNAPNAILLIATNPVDIMTAITTRIAKKHGVPATRIIGSGTILDTARFRALVAAHLGVSSHSVHAHVLGEHGDSEVLHWSGASVSNLSLRAFSAQIGAPITDEIKEKITTAVRKAAYSIIEGKGATYYGIGAGMARLADAIIRDEHAVITCCSVLERVEKVTDICLSLPHIISAKGIEKTLYPIMDSQERDLLEESAMILKSYMEKL